MKALGEATKRLRDGGNTGPGLAATKAALADLQEQAKSQTPDWSPWCAERLASDLDGYASALGASGGGPEAANSCQAEDNPIDEATAVATAFDFVERFDITKLYRDQIAGLDQVMQIYVDAARTRGPWKVNLRAPDPKEPTKIYSYRLKGGCFTRPLPVNVTGATPAQWKISLFPLEKIDWSVLPKLAKDGVKRSRIKRPRSIAFDLDNDLNTGKIVYAVSIRAPDQSVRVTYDRSGRLLGLERDRY